MHLLGLTAEEGQQMKEKPKNKGVLQIDFWKRWRKRHMKMIMKSPLKIILLLVAETAVQWVKEVNLCTGKNSEK